MKWCVQGYYGFGNIGDDVLLYETIRGIRLIDPSSTIRVLSNPVGVENLKGFLGENVPDFFVDSKSRIECVRSILKSDIFLTGGGTCFHQFGFCGFLRNVIAKVLGKKVVWLAIGADKITGCKARLKARIAISACDRVFVRDQKSLSILKKRYHWKSKFILTEDLFWLHRLNRKNSESKRFLVSWRDLDAYFSKESQRAIVDVVARSICDLVVSKGFDEVIVADSCSLVDREANDLLYRKINDGLGCTSVLVTREDSCTSREYLEILCSSSFVFSARMHPYLFSKSIQIPSLSFGYASKSFSYANYFHPLRIFEASSGLSDSGSLCSQLVAEWASPSVLSISNDVLKARASENFNQLSLYCL